MLGERAQGWPIAGRSPAASGGWAVGCLQTLDEAAVLLWTAGSQLQREEPRSYSFSDLVQTQRCPGALHLRVHGRRWERCLTEPCIVENTESECISSEKCLKKCLCDNDGKIFTVKFPAWLKALLMFLSEVLLTFSQRFAHFLAGKNLTPLLNHVTPHFHQLSLSLLPFSWLFP